MDENINIIFLIVDALRAQNLSCYGYPISTSPTIDSLSEKGLLFRNAYSCIDNTDPSFTSIFSGKYPLSHGIIHQAEISKREIQEFQLTQTKLLQQIVKEHKFYTIGIDWLGRWHKKGFEFYGITEKNDYIKYKDNITKIKKLIRSLPSPLRSTIRKTFLYLKKPPPTKKNAFYMTNLAINKIKELKKDNFFLLIHYWDVHTPFDTIPDNFIEKFKIDQTHISVNEMFKKIKYPIWQEKVKHYHLKGIKFIEEIEARYNSAINYVDYQINRLISFLKDFGLYDNTLIVFTGDHGDNLMRNDIFTGHSGLYEEVIHVPLILMGKGLSEGKKINSFVQHIDIVPTILEILKINPSLFHLDGMSLIPLIQKKNRQIHSEIYVMEAARRRFAVRDKNYKYIYSPTENDLFHNYWKEKGKLYQPICKKRIELYDLRNDPKEQYNIIDQFPEIGITMEKKLLHWIENLKTKKEKIILKNKINTIKI
jgi:arylsulfatase A-like enzyme